MKLNLTLHRHQYFSKIYDQTLKIKTIAAIESYVLKSQPLVIWATHENIKMEKINIAEHLLPALK